MAIGICSQRSKSRRWITGKSKYIKIKKFVFNERIKKNLNYALYGTTITTIHISQKLIL